MCLAIPLRVKAIIDESNIQVESNGLMLNISSALVKDVKTGDYVLVHAGFAIQKMSEEEAKETLSIIVGDENE